MRPDRVVIGVESKRSEKILKSLYHPLHTIETSIVATNIETSEIIKYASKTSIFTSKEFIPIKRGLMKTPSIARMAIHISFDLNAKYHPETPVTPNRKSPSTGV